jgi:hypothetical protein
MTDTEDAEGEPALIVVRAGAADRFAALESAFGPEGVGVVWDRRVRDRRQRVGDLPPPTERRRIDRRGPAPASWVLLDFLVVPGARPAS